MSVSMRNRDRRSPMAEVLRRLSRQRTARMLACSVTCLMLLGTSCRSQSETQAKSTTSGNYLQNNDFEQGSGPVPAGWTLDQAAAGKGKIEVIDAEPLEGRQSLRLAPNQKNAAPDHVFGVGQGFPIDTFRGKQLRVSGTMRAEGDAIGVIGAYTIRADGSTAQAARLTQTSADDAGLQQSTLNVAKDDNSLALVFMCSVEGTSGSVTFDGLYLGELREVEEAPGPEPVPQEPLAASVTVDAGEVIREIPRTLYGTNIEWIYDGYGLWDAGSNRLNPRLVELTKDLQPSLIRFPGGVFSDFYHWRDGVGPRETRKTTAHVPGSAKSRHNFGTDEAMQFAREAGGELLITVNIGAGTPDEAAAWVRYVNREQADRLGRVRYWEIGNEQWSKNTPGNETLTPDAYVERYLRFAQAMKAVDPDIKLAAIGGENFGRYQMNSYPGWNREVLTRAGREMDLLAVHNAYFPLMGNDRGEDVRTVYQGLLAAPMLIADNLRTLSQQIERFAPARSDEIAIAITEWGPWFHAEPGSRWVDHVKTMGSALYTASTLKVFIESPKTDVANAFKLVDNAFMGWIGLRNGRYIPKAPYFAMQMYTKHFGEKLISSEVDVPTYDCSPAGLVDRVRNVPYLDVVSSLSRDGDRLYVLAINKHMDRPIEASIGLRGFDPAGSAKAWTLSGSGIDSHTGTQLPQIPGLDWADQAKAQTNPRFDKGSPDDVAIRSQEVDGVSTRFEYTFPPHSVTSLEIRRAD